MSLGYAGEASLAIQKVYDDPALDQLAERLEEVLILLDENPYDPQLRRRRMHQPSYWLVQVHGSGQDFAFLWDFLATGQPFVFWAVTHSELRQAAIRRPAEG